jgi:LPS export ABC transporter protein LptC
MNPTDIVSSKIELKTAEQIKKMAQSQQSQRAIEQKMQGVHYVENSKNQKGWELFAEEAAGSTDSLWVLKKVRVEFFADDQSSYQVTGDIGEIDGVTKNILIRGQVITTSTNGYSFKTNDLRFDSKTKSLKSDDSVQMNGPPDQSGTGFELNGIGFNIDIHKNTMTILNSVNATKTINQKQMSLTSNQAFFSNKSQEGHFKGQVKLVYNKAVVQAPEAIFKYLMTEKKLKTILLKTNVILTEFDRKGSCRELEMDLELDQMILRGAPKVRMQDDEITGSEIIFYDGGQKIKINNVKVSGSPKDKNND